MGNMTGEKVSERSASGWQMWGGTRRQTAHTHTPHTCESLVVCGLSWMDEWMEEKSDESQVCFEFCQELREGLMHLTPV